MLNNPSFCPGCFRTIQKGFLRLLCPDCELQQTIKNEAEKTRRVMREQERQNEKERSMRAKEQQYNKRQQQNTSPIREAEETSFDSSAMLQLVPIKHEDIKNFNQEAEELINNPNHEDLESLFNEAEKRWPIEEVHVSITLLDSAQIPESAKTFFLSALKGHLLIRHVIALILVDIEGKASSKDVQTWALTFPERKRHMDFYINLLVRVIKSTPEDDFIENFTDKYPWHKLPTKDLDKILSEMVMVPKWEKASKIIAKNLISYITELQETKSLIVVMLEAKESGDEEKVIYCMTLLASRSKEAKKALLAVNAYEMFSHKIANANEEILNIGETFFNKWKTLSEDTEVLEHIVQQKNTLDRQVQNELVMRHNGLEDRTKAAWQAWKTCFKEEAEELKKHCQKELQKFRFCSDLLVYACPDSEHDGLKYSDIARAEGEHLQNLFERVLFYRKHKAKTVVWSSVLFMNLGPAEESPKAYLALALVWILFGEFFRFLLPLSSLPMYWYAIKLFRLFYAKRQIEKTVKIEDMRFATGAYESEWNKLCEEKDKQAKLKRAA